jgi:hypothetical protein
MEQDLTRIRNRTTGRFSSWDETGRNGDRWNIPPHSSRVLADIQGPAQITHMWMTQRCHYRECLLRVTYDNASDPSILVPLGDFFGLGHGMINSYDSALFSASTNHPNTYEACALNSYVQLPFAKRCVVEIVNESDEDHMQFFYVDYETLPALPSDTGYLHAEFRRANPFGGWAGDAAIESPLVDVANTERLAWDNNYVILETAGRGHYIGCNLSVTNFHGSWWGEGDDMIWVDGYHWPPDLHGTGSEDYLNQAWGMHPNAFRHNGTTIYEAHSGGYQTSYVFHLENPVRFQKSIKVTIEHGHGNHLCNEMSSTAYWYAEHPTSVAVPPAVSKRLQVLRDNRGTWLHDEQRQCPGRPVRLSDEMQERRQKLYERPGKE